MAPLSKPTSMKSFRWPDWSEASCLLSVKLRSLRASGFIASSRFRPATADVDKIVVAVLRPSDPIVPNLGKSERCRAEWVTPQERQKIKGVGINAAAWPPGPTVPLG